MEHSRLRQTIGMVAAAGALIVGCADADDTQAPPTQTPPTPADADAAAGHGFADLLPRMMSLYFPTEGPAELAEKVDIVAEGRLLGFSEGGVLGWPDDPMHHVRTAVMEIAVDKIVKGKLAANDGGVLHLEVWLHTVDGRDLTFEDLDRATPKGARVVAYARVIRTPPDDPHPPLEDWPGAASGKTLYHLQTPEDFYIATDDGIFRPWGTASGRAPLPYGEPVTGSQPIDLADLLPPTQTWPYERP